MRYCRRYAFADGISGYCLGRSLAGPPLMTVYCYAFGQNLIDTGLAHMARESLALAREHGVRRIFLTHHHEDHSGNAALIRSRTGATVFGHDQAGEKLKTRYPVLPYQKIVWGRSSPVDVRPMTTPADTVLGPLVPVHTPGHCRDHLCYLLPDQGVLFSGDLYLGDRIKYFRSDEDLGQEIASLKAVAALDFDTLLCGHNPRGEQGKARVLAKLSFLEDFYGTAADLCRKGMEEKAIFREMALQENRFIKWFCFGNVSMMNGVRSVLKNLKKSPA